MPGNTNAFGTDNGWFRIANDIMMRDPGYQAKMAAQAQADALRAKQVAARDAGLSGMPVDNPRQGFIPNDVAAGRAPPPQYLPSQGGSGQMGPGGAPFVPGQMPMPPRTLGREALTPFIGAPNGMMAGAPQGPTTTFAPQGQGANPNSMAAQIRMRRLSGR